jgi:hypothetical protein
MAFDTRIAEFSTTRSTPEEVEIGVAHVVVGVCRDGGPEDRVVLTMPIKAKLEYDPEPGTPPVLSTEKYFDPPEIEYSFVVKDAAEVRYLEALAVNELVKRGYKKLPTKGESDGEEKAADTPSKG